MNIVYTLSFTISDACWCDMGGDVRSDIFTDFMHNLLEILLSNGQSYRHTDVSRDSL